MTHNKIEFLAKDLLSQLESKILGQKKVCTEVVVTVLCQGHALLTGAPGVAKTTLVKNLASALGSDWKRIQFTPDLTPFDILGGDTLSFDEKNPENRKIVFTKGPIFASFVLADEINRASPKTQSALLEAMQEKQVSVGGISRALPQPFFVFATQNPIENEGTFPLPEAQLDRFLLNIEVPYPEFEAEVAVALLPQQSTICEPINEANTLLFQGLEAVRQVVMSPAILESIVRIVRNTRPESTHLKMVKEFLAFGASPRASQALTLASKALALLSGQAEVSMEHVVKIAPSVLRHRCVPAMGALRQDKSMNEIIQEILQDTLT